jgi:hypothetical protein
VKTASRLKLDAASRRRSCSPKWQKLSKVGDMELTFRHHVLIRSAATLTLLFAASAISSKSSSGHFLLADLVISDTSDFLLYAKKYGSWQLDPKAHTYSSDGIDGSHHINGIGDVSLSYYEGDKNAWFYTIDQTSKTIDDVVSPSQRIQVRKNTGSNLYKITVGKLKGKLIQTYSYQPQIDVYTDGWSHKFYKESY